MDLVDCAHHTASARHHTIFCVQDKPFAEMVAAKSTKSTHSTGSSTRLRLGVVKTCQNAEWLETLKKLYEVTDPCEELPDFAESARRKSWNSYHAGTEHYRGPETQVRDTDADAQES